MSDSSASALRLDHVSKVYRKSHLGRTKVTRGVEDISLEITQGEVFGLLGPNGSGKTTMIKLILGLLFPTQGTVQIKGLSSTLVEARKIVGYLPEVPYFYKYLTAREVLRFYGLLSQMS